MKGIETILQQQQQDKEAAVSDDDDDRLQRILSYIASLKAESESLKENECVVCTGIDGTDTGITKTHSRPLSTQDAVFTEDAPYKLLVKNGNYISARRLAQHPPTSNILYQVIELAYWELKRRMDEII